jgi:type I restriction enzyme M protein
MDPAHHAKIASFIWNIADDVLRDVYVRGKYRDVILPMTVLRRLDAVLEPTKDAVLAMELSLNEAKISNQDGPLRDAARQPFYNTSPFTLRDLRSRTNQQQLRTDFEAYLDGFSSNVQEILDNFEFRNQIPRLSKADAIGGLLEKFLDPAINLSPKPVMNLDGSEKHPGLDNHAMGTIFEELVRRFNEENNEEAGEHWTPRDAVKLMARLVLLPIADEIESGTYLLYDGACGTGGMLTVAEDTLQEIAATHGKEIETHLYGQEINAETYAIAKGDLLLKGEGEAADNLVGGPEHSTLSNDAFPSREFDFMLSNPPYGKSWSGDLERLGGKRGIKDPRFIVEHAGDPEFSFVTRSSDGQMMFLANLVSKMKHKTKLGSRIAEVHNGSSLFTGDAGQGESNLRRWIIESDWLEAIVALPPNMFYNTPIATFVWVLSNRKSSERQGTVQLIDGTKWFKQLRKPLGMKTRELAEEDIARICDVFMRFTETEECKVLPNQAFGYWRIPIQRPLRVIGADPSRAHSAKEIKDLKDEGVRGENGSPVIRRIHKVGTVDPDPLHGLFETKLEGKVAVVEYEADPTLRTLERVPFQDPGGVDGFVKREILPHTPDAWIDAAKQQIGYEVNWNRYFSKPVASRPLDEIREDILTREEQTKGLVTEIHSAMTRGVRPGQRVRPSGQTWLGDVPEHWRLVPLRAMLKLRKEIVGENSDQFTLLSLTLRGIVPRDLDNPQGKFPADFASYQVVEPGDLVFCLFDVDETPRTVGLSRHKGMITGAYTVFRCVDEMTANYLYLFFLAMDQHKRLRPLYTGLRKVIPKDVLLQIKVPMPPEDELQAILKFVNAEAVRVDEASGLLKEQMGLLAQYRASMVADVVTGKLDVSKAAKFLPDNVEADRLVEAVSGDGTQLADSDEVDHDEIHIRDGAQT